MRAARASRGRAESSSRDSLSTFRGERGRRRDTCALPSGPSGGVAFQPPALAALAEAVASGWQVVAGRSVRRLGVRLAVVVASVAASLAAHPAQAQTRLVEILNADVGETTADSLGEVQRLEGNVRMRQDTTLLSARQVTYYVTRGEVVMSGDVEIVSGRDTLTSATVVYDSNDKTAVARGAVRLGDGESVLLAPEVSYDTRAEFATFEGDGEIRHRGAVLTSPSGSYSSARRFAEFDGPVTLTDSSGTVQAERGTYDARVRRADFAGAVFLRRPDATLDADSLVYFRRTERARAYGRVVLQRIGDGGQTGDAPADSSRRTFLFGETLLFDGQAETASARGLEAGPDGPALDPLLLVLRGDGSGRVDTTLARAPRIDAARTVAGADTVTVITTAGGARVWERRLRAVADSVAFRRQSGAGLAVPDGLADAVGGASTGGARAGATSADSSSMRTGTEPDTGTARADGTGGAGTGKPESPAATTTASAPGTAPASGAEADAPDPAVRDQIRLFGSRPSVWADGAQITGDSLAVFATAGAADSLVVRGQAFAARVDSTLGRLQQIAGLRMLGRFAGDELRQLDVWPNAQALYYRATPEGLLDGAFEFSLDSLSFQFEGGELTRIDGDRGIAGTVYGPSNVPETRRLPGFAYTIDGGPTRPGLLGDGWEAGWLERYGPTPDALRPAGGDAPPADGEPDDDAPGPVGSPPTAASLDGR